MSKNPAPEYIYRTIEAELYHIIDSDGDVNQALNDTGHTLLHSACQNNSSKAVALLLGSGANVNQLTIKGTSAICMAAVSADTTIVKLLLSAGADVFRIEWSLVQHNDCVIRKATPLQLALSNNYPPVYHLLTAHMILEITLAMVPLNLPAYVLMWIMEWSNPEFARLKEFQRITLIQNVINSCRKIKDR
jgi:hypothetical protein